MLEKIVGKFRKKEETLGMLPPPLYEAYEAMRNDLESVLGEKGEFRVNKIDPPEGLIGSMPKYEYELMDKQGRVVAKVTYESKNKGVTIEHLAKTKEMDKFKERIETQFVKEWDKHFDDYVKKFEKKYGGIILHDKKPFYDRIKGAVKGNLTKMRDKLGFAPEDRANSYAFSQMQLDLENKLAGLGKVSKAKIKDSFWQKTNQWEYQVTDKNSQVVALVNYNTTADTPVNIVYVNNTQGEPGEMKMKQFKEFLIDSWKSNFTNYLADYTKKYIQKSQPAAVDKNVISA